VCSASVSVKRFVELRMRLVQCIRQALCLIFRLWINLYEHGQIKKMFWHGYMHYSESNTAITVKTTKYCIVIIINLICIKWKSIPGTWLLLQGNPYHLCSTGLVTDHWHGYSRTLCEHSFTTVANNSSLKSSDTLRWIFFQTKSHLTWYYTSLS